MTDTEREPIRSRVPVSDEIKQDRLDDLNPPPRLPDTERGRALLEARREQLLRCQSASVTERAKETYAYDIALIDLALAVDRRRQAETVIRELHTQDIMGHPSEVYHALEDATAAEDDALDALLAHLAGEGVGE
jgi:hypothetical protein